LASIPVDGHTLIVDLTNVFWFIANNRPPLDPDPPVACKKNPWCKTSQFIKALLQLSYIKALKKWLKSPNMKNTSATSKAKMITDELSMNTWPLKDLRGMRRVNCSRIPGPRPTPRPTQGVYCDNDMDSGFAADRCMQRRGNPIQCAQGPNKIQNCSIGCGKTCQNESWWKCVSNCPGQGNAIFCSSDRNPCPVSSTDYSGVH